MTKRTFDYYVVTVEAGPGRAAVDIHVQYVDEDGEIIHEYGQGLFAFGATWKDVAVTILHGLRAIPQDRVLADPRHPSPHLDLT